MGRTPQAPWVSLLAAVMAILGTAACRTENPRGADMTVPFQSYTLDNGLTVILMPDHTVPVLQVAMRYRTGALNEEAGRTGIAHLLEHLTYRGSKHASEDWSSLLRAGGSYLATTYWDATLYRFTMRPAELELALWLESERMGFFAPAITERHLALEKKSVHHELTERITSDPHARTLAAIHAALFPELALWDQSPGGRIEDVARLTREDVAAFARRWYVPAAATLLLAGDLRPDVARTLVDKWFGSFPRLPVPETRRLTGPERLTPGRQVVVSKSVDTPLIAYGWRVPGPFQPGQAEALVLAQMLETAAEGTLLRTLERRKIVHSSTIGYTQSGGFGAFLIQLDLTAGTSVGAAETALREEVERLRRDPVDPAEHQRVITAMEADLVYSLDSLGGRAVKLLEYNHYLGRPDGFAQDLARFRSTTPVSIRDAARRLLDPAGRVEIITLPEDHGGAAPANATRSKTSPPP